MDADLKPVAASAEHYTSIDQVHDRFVEVIGAMNSNLGLGLRETAVRDYAQGFARHFWNERNGTIRTTSSLFDLSDKITGVVHALADIGITNKDVFVLFNIAKTASNQKVETIEQKIRGLCNLVLQFKDPIVSVEERYLIGTPRDSFRYIVAHSGVLNKMTVASESIDLFRRYAELVRDNKIQHDSYAVSGRSTAHAILNMTVHELKERLADYDDRLARSTAARAARPVVVPPAPKRPGAAGISTPAGRQAAAARFLAHRASRTLSQN